MREGTSYLSFGDNYRNLSLLLLKLFAVSAEVTLVHHSVGRVIRRVLAGHPRSCWGMLYRLVRLALLAMILDHSNGASRLDENITAS